MNQQNAYPQQQPQQRVNFADMDPKNFDSKVKNKIINENIFHAGYGNYKVCPVSSSVRFPYNRAYNAGTINNICRVMVHNKHSLDIASTLCDHGLNSLTARKPIPAVIYPTGTEFLGTNLESREGMYDENIILRTNYPYVIKKQTDLFPIKEGQKAVIYSNPITIIRDSNYNPMNYDDIYKIGVITMCYDRKSDLLIENVRDDSLDTKKDEKSGKHKEMPKETKMKENKLLTSADLLRFQILLETVFQAAICGCHEVMILSLFGREFGIPVDDQIMIFNSCIMKYGHIFKGIMICIPPYEGKDLYEYFDKYIIKPNFITKDIDMKYQAEAMSQRLNVKNDEDNDFEDDYSDKKVKKRKSIEKLDTLEGDDKMKVLKKIIKAKKEEAKKAVKSKKR